MLDSLQYSICFWKERAVLKMKLCDIFLLIIIKFFVKADKIEKEFNLNFQQNDYQVKFERVELVRYSKSFFKDFSIATFKYNRTVAVLNVTLTFAVDVGYDVEGVVQAYKFMSNEYRFFPVHFAANACKAYAANVAGVATSMKCGNVTGCPWVKEKRYHVCNWHPDQSKLPPFIPNGQYKVEIQLLHSSIEMAFANGYATVSRPIVHN